MKIIKPGKPEKLTFWWLEKHFSCKMCKCIFELEEKDYPSNALVNANEFNIKCPCCASILHIKKPDPLSEEPLFEEIFGEKGLFDKIFGKYK